MKRAVARRVVRAERGKLIEANLKVIVSEVMAE